MAQQAVAFTSSSKEVQCWPEGGSILLLYHHFLSGALQRTAHKLCRAPVLQRPQLRQHCFDELRFIRLTRTSNTTSESCRWCTPDCHQWSFLIQLAFIQVEWTTVKSIFRRGLSYGQVNCYLLALLLSQSTSENAYEYRRSYFTRYPRHIEFLVAFMT
jgi:hypothetical protein